MVRGGFSEAELAAAKWQQEQKYLEKQKCSQRKSHHSADSCSSSLNSARLRHRRHSPKTTRKHHRSRSHSSHVSHDIIPRDPKNPLHAAYKRNSKYSIRDTRKYEHRKRSCSPKNRFRSEIKSEEATKMHYKQSVLSDDEWQHDAFRRSPSPDRRRTEGEMWDTRKGWRSRAGGVYLPPEEDETKERRKPAKYVVPFREEELRFYHSSVSRDRSPTPEERPSPVYE